MEISEYINTKRDIFVSDLAHLVEINSVRSEAKDGMPFGEGCARVLEEAGKILGEHGYKMTNFSSYAGEADLGKEPCLMLLAHLDVVPAGDGWTKEPFALTLEGDRAYGRGTTDDKGAVLACILAMDACRALYGEPKKGVRLVVGCSEETGSEDMAYYFSHRPMLSYTLSPDADYPLINIEKGGFAPHFTKQLTPSHGTRRIIEITGGDTDNIVPGKATALFAGFTLEEVEKYAREASKITKAEFICEQKGCFISVLAKGESAHAAVPHTGNNAQTALLTLADSMPFDGCDLTSGIGDILRLFPHNETDGSSAGVKMSDAESGELTLNFGVLKITEDSIMCGLDLRCPLCANEENVKAVIKNDIEAAGFTFDGDPKMRPVHRVPEDSELVRVLLGVYENRTCNRGECLAIGGGTYVHGIEGGVAFGVEFPGRDYHIHGADEFCIIDEMLLTASMYADVIKRLCY